MARILYKLRRFTLISLAALLILVALSQGVLRLLLPLANDQRQRLEAELSNLLQTTVTIGRIDSHWDYFVPYLDLVDIRIQPDGEARGHQFLSRLSIGLNAIDMLLAGSAAPSTLQVEGLSLVLARDGSGAFYLPGVAMPQSSNESLVLDWQSIISHKQVELSNSRLILRHDQTEQQQIFDQVDIQFSSSGGRYQGHAHWQPPIEMGEAAAIEFDLVGQLDKAKSWSGKVNVDVPPMNLVTLNPYLPSALRLRQGHMGMQLALEMSQTGVSSSRGLIDTQLSFKDGESIAWQGPIFVDSQAGRLELKVAEPVRIQGFSEQIEAAQLLQGLNIDIEAGEHLAVGLGVAELDVPRGLALAQYFAPLSESWQSRLQKMQAQGYLRELFAGWDSQHGWNASVKIRDLTTLAVERIPGIDALNADMLYQQDTLSLSFDEQALSLDTNGMFLKPFQLERLHGEVQLYKDAEQWVLHAPSLFLNTPDIKTHSDLSLRFEQGKKPFLTLHATAEDGVASSTPFYVPRFLKPGTLKWFDQAFLGGRVTSADAYLKGYVNELARENSSAIFRIDADVEDVKLSYAKGWPVAEHIDAHFHMNGVRMEVEASAAQTFNLQPRYAKAVIPNARRSSLELHVEAPHSPIDGLLRYVNESPISSLIGDVGRSFTGEGYVDVVLSLQKNISKKHYTDLKPYFQGKVRLQKTQLTMPSLDLPLADLQGSIDFSQSHVYADRLQGTVLGQAFTASAKTEGKDAPRVSLTAQTTLGASDVLKQRAALITDHVKGRAPWNVVLELPLSKGQKSASLSLKSNLKGVALNFPEPLRKPASQASEFAAYIALNKQAANRVWLDYQRELQGVLVFSRQGKGLYSGRLNYLRGKPELPRGQGLLIDAAIAEVDISPWLELATADKGEGDRAEAASVLQRIDLEADRLHYQGAYVDGVKASLEQVSKTWLAMIKSDALTGELRLPMAKAPMQLDLSLLDLNKIHFAKSKEAGLFSPVKLPDVELKLDNLRWDEMQIQGFSASLKSIASGVRVQQFAVADAALMARGEGAWQVNAEGHHESLIEFKASAPDMKAALAKLGVNNLLKTGVGEFQGSLRWAKPPYQFDLASLSGQVNGDITKGDLLAVKPGIAKVFGLLNVDSLPKRLALDFKDMSSKGLAFDKANMQVRVDQGIAYFDRMKLETDLGAIAIEGRTDLVKQELDQIAKVNPDVSNLLPVTAGVVGGVPGLVGALLVDQVVKAFGGDTDRVAQIRYKITGSWDNPVVESTRVDRVKDLSEDELRQRAEELIIKAQGVDYGQTVVPGELELGEEEEEAIFDEE